MLPDVDQGLITEVEPQAFFQDALHAVIARHHLSPNHETTLYLSNLLTLYMHTENLFEQTEDGTLRKPLAQLYADAVDARSLGERDAALRQLGDVALFISGLFPQSLTRSPVDVDYYISMGGSAYGFLAESGRVAGRTKVFKLVFHELSDRFPEFVDILAELGDDINLRNDSDILRLYEIWLCSDSKNAADKLHKLGIFPVHINRRTH